MKIKAGKYHLEAGSQVKCKNGEYRITTNTGESGFMSTDCGGFDLVPDEEGFFIFNEEAEVKPMPDAQFSIEAGGTSYIFQHVA